MSNGFGGFNISHIRENTYFKTVSILRLNLKKQNNLGTFAKVF